MRALNNTNRAKLIGLVKQLCRNPVMAQCRFKRRIVRNVDDQPWLVYHIIEETWNAVARRRFKSTMQIEFGNEHVVLWCDDVTVNELHMDFGYQIVSSTNSESYENKKGIVLNDENLDHVWSYMFGGE